MVSIVFVLLLMIGRHRLTSDSSLDPPARRVWTRDDLLLALNLYGRLPFGRMHRSAPEVIALSSLIGRTPSAVAMRLGNFASLAPALQRRGIRGMQNTGSGVSEIWAEYERSPEALIEESERLLARLQAGRTMPATLEVDPAIVGLEREVTVLQRVNQAYFRRLMLARYGSRCCITGLDEPRLLVAAHIISWAEAPDIRVDPRNGLCLNALYDRAFEVGVLTVDGSYRIHVDERFATGGTLAAREAIVRLDGEYLRFSGDARPSPELLERHRAKFLAR